MVDLVIEFCIHNEAVDCPFENVNDCQLECWSPLNPTKVYRTDQPNKGEKEGLLVRYHPPSGDAIEWSIPLTATAVNQHDVVLVVHVLSKQPRDLAEGRRTPILERHIATCCLFGDDLMSPTIIRQSTHLVETKWIHQRRKHTEFHFDMENNGIEVIPTTSPAEYWDQVLQTIWTDHIQKEIDWMADPHSRRVLALTPPSMCIHGMPVEVATGGGEYTFAVSKGLSASALWIQPPNQVVTDQWIHQSLQEILAIRGATLEDFLAVPLNRPSEDQQKCLSDVVKLMTIHTTTWPYVTDHVILNKPDGRRENQIIDVMEAARLRPGDCEDSASMAVQIATDILNRTDTKDPIIIKVRQCIAVLGVPCGMNGSIVDPNQSDELELQSHMFAGFIPIPMYASMIGQPFDLHKMMKDFGFTDKPYIPLHIALMEGTVLSTPYYTSRDHLAEDKKQKAHQVRSVLQQMVDEGDPAVWKNYCVPLPLTMHQDKGFHVHHAVYRVHTHAESFFFTSTTPWSVKVKSYVLYDQTGDLGIPGTEFFCKYLRVPEGWSMKEPVIRTHEVWALEQEVTRQFLHPHPVPLDRSLKPPHLHHSDRNHRLHVFVWQHRGQETDLVIQKIKQTIGAKDVIEEPYGHGTMITFIW
jgi:hypothetical protein